MKEKRVDIRKVKEVKPLQTLSFGKHRRKGENEMWAKSIPEK